MFEAWRQLLFKWNKAINLVSARSLEGFWQRHALDSWQLVTHIPASTETVIDLGSGAGFPGLAIAIAFRERGRGQVSLVEAAGKKANFLRTVARELELPVEVRNVRVETLTPKPYDLVTARAFAPLPRLFEFAERFWAPQTLGLFPKGETAKAEIAAAREIWTFSVDIHPSRSSETGKLLAIRDLARI